MDLTKDWYVVAPSRNRRPFKSLYRHRTMRYSFCRFMLCSVYKQYQVPTEEVYHLERNNKHTAESSRKLFSLVNTSIYTKANKSCFKHVCVCVCVCVYIYIYMCQ
jgi:hypothetical protein